MSRPTLADGEEDEAAPGTTPSGQTKKIDLVEKPASGGACKTC
jgi:hypothetical protein